MGKPLFSFLFLLFFNFCLSQSAADLAYMFDGEVELQSSLENTILADVNNGLSVLISINNKDYKFLIDTGASMSVLNDKVFINTNSPVKKIKVQDAFGAESEKDLFYLNFKLRNNQFSNFAFVKLDFSKFFKNNCSGYDGILGSNVLKKLNWKFSKKENKLFFSKNTFSYEGFNKPFKLLWSGNIPIAELEIDSFKFLAIIDSGHFGTILIPDYIYKNSYNDYYQLINARGNPMSGISGVQKSDLKKSHFKNLKLGDYDLSQYEGIVMTAKPNIGNGIILENGFILNSLSNEMAFGANQEKSKYETLPKLKICRSKTDKTKIEVCFFWNEQSNKVLKLQDQVIKIDHIDTSNISDSNFCSIMKYFNENGFKTILLKRGHREFEYTIN